MACVHPQDYVKVGDYNVSDRDVFEFAEFAYRGALLLKREHMKIPKPPLLKNPKLEPGNEICVIHPNTQKRFESLGSINSVEALMEERKRKRVETDAISNAIIECKLLKGQALSPHVQKMIGFFQNLEKLGFPISQELSIGIVLGSLPDEYGSFIRNFYKGDFEKTLNEVHEMLKSFEIKFRKDNVTKPKCRGKQDAHIQNPVPKSVAKALDLCNYCNQLGHWKRNCNYCNQLGHWKRNCKQYLQDRKNGGLNLL